MIRARSSLTEDLAGDEKKIADCFKDGGIFYPDTIASLTKLTQQEVAAGLMMLELKHIIAKRADGSFERRY